MHDSGLSLQQFHKLMHFIFLLWVNKLGFKEVELQKVYCLLSSKNGTESQERKLESLIDIHFNACSTINVCTLLGRYST